MGVLLSTLFSFCVFNLFYGQSWYNTKQLGSATVRDFFNPAGSLGGSGLGGDFSIFVAAGRVLRRRVLGGDDRLGHLDGGQGDLRLLSLGELGLQHLLKERRQRRRGGILVAVGIVVIVLVRAHALVVAVVSIAVVVVIIRRGAGARAHSLHQGGHHQARHGGASFRGLRHHLGEHHHHHHGVHARRRGRVRALPARGAAGRHARTAHRAHHGRMGGTRTHLLLEARLHGEVRGARRHHRGHAGGVRALGRVRASRRVRALGRIRALGR